MRECWVWVKNRHPEFSPRFFNGKRSEDLRSRGWLEILVSGGAVNLASVRMALRLHAQRKQLMAHN